MIDFEHVSFSYDNRTRALDDVTLHVAPGELVCVLGGNGSGKSTLAKHMNALLVPDDGTVCAEGLRTDDEANTYRIRSTVGMVFQNPDDQLVATLVEDDVAFGPENLGVPAPDLRKRVSAALHEVGLDGFERNETHALSGGQKQRVAIAGVLAMQPKVLVLDEASAMLDPRGRASLRRVCRDLHARGMTIVSITHFMEEAADADRVVVMEAGRIAMDGAPEEVLARRDVLERLNLDVPFAADCAAALGLPACVTEDALVQEIIAKRPWEAAAAPAPAAEPAARRAPVGRITPDAPHALAPSDAPRAATPKPSAPADADSSHTDAPLVEFRDVSFTYDADQAKRAEKRGRRAKWGNDPDERWALRDVSLAVRRGEFLGIAGHTGSGKSTLIQHMNGILRPTSGTVAVKGADASAKSGAAAARATVGMVFQYPEHQLFADTVRNDVAFGPRNLGLSEGEVAARVESALARVGLDAAAIGDKSPFELSGGQQRRVAFAGVLAMEPEALVLDEPAAGLDPAARASFLSLIESLHGDGLTVVMVSHSMDDLARLCDRVAVMNEGRLFALGTPADVFLRADDLQAIGLDVPAPQRVANRLRAAGVPLAADTLFDTASLVRALRGTEPR